MKKIWIILVHGQFLEAYEDTMKAQDRYFELYDEYGSNVTRHQIDLR